MLAKRAKYAGVIEVTHSPTAFEMKIDGEAFPWQVLDGVGTSVSHDDQAYVEVRIPADKVSVVNQPFHGQAQMAPHPGHVYEDAE